MNDVFFKYPLTNGDDGPHMESDINIKDVNIKIINSNEEVFNEKYILGFWRDKSKLNQIIDCIEQLKITSNRKESESLVYGATKEYVKLFDIKQIPYGFEVNGSLYSTTEDKEKNIVRKLITHTPVWVPYQYYNCDSDSMMLDLAFYNKNNRLSIVTIPQKEAFQRRGIMDVAAHGALLEEAKAGQLINWLVNYIHHNEIPVNNVFERFGWKDDLSFVSQFTDLTIMDTDFNLKGSGGVIDAISGATVTSNAICLAAVNAKEVYQKLKPEIIKQMK